ncbi:MAG TPA: response regulator [bacterium]|nr:response regulator [bacterium]
MGVEDTKRDAKETQSRESQLRAILDGIDEVVYIADPDTYEVLYANKAIEKLFGNVIGRKCYAAFQNLDSPCDFCTNGLIFGENVGKTHIWEFNNQAVGRWYRCIDRAIEWPDGRLVRYEMAVDVHDRKQAEEELLRMKERLEHLVGERTEELDAAKRRLEEDIVKISESAKKAEKSEKEFRLAFEEARDAIFWAEAQTGTLINCNKAAEKLIARDRSEIIGAPQSILHPPVEERYYKKVFETHVVEKGAFDIEAEVITSDGRRIPVLISSSVMEIDGRQINQGVFHNISDFKWVEKSLKDFSAYQSVVAEMRGVEDDAPEKELLEVFLKGIVDNFGILMAWHGAYSEGKIKPGARAGKADNYLDGLELDIRRPESPDAQCAMSRAILDGKPFGYSDLAADDGFRRWRDYALELGYASNLALPLSVEGEIEGGIMLYAPYSGAFDAERTERLGLLTRELGAELRARRMSGAAIQMEESLKSQLMQAQKMEALGALAGGIAHDFNNMLAVVMGTADAALCSIDPADSNYAKYERIYRCCRRGKDLTMKLLTFARKEKIEAKPAILNDVVAEVVDILKRSISKKIKIETEFDDGIPPVVVDQTQIHQAVLNICLNAADAMPGGGSLRLKTFAKTAEPPADAAAGPSGPREFCVVSIADTGQGIASDIIGAIFDPFFTTKEPGKGTGLGLSIAHGIIKNHGGWIDARSEVGKFTVFDVHIPAGEVADERMDEDSRGGRRCRGEKILVIDDDHDFLEMACEVLESEGCSPVSANTGAGGISIFERMRDELDLVILDMMMLDMDGADVFKRLRQIKTDAKVIVCSGFSRDGQASATLADGAAGYLQKPFGLDDLVKAIRYALDK